jgi:cell division protein FtsL
LPKVPNLEPMKNILTKIPKRFYSISLLLVLFVANLIISQLVLGVNIRLSELGRKISVVETKNSSLKVKAAKLASTQYLLKQARRYGFVETVKVVYLLQPEILAKND